jgi:DNA-binding XRE family transcriptional regulator
MNKKDFTEVSIESLVDKHIGPLGSERRTSFENELRLDLLGQAIKGARQAKNLTQAQLGQLVGVQKAQISKIETSAKSTRLDTILKVFSALGVKVHFSLE